MCCESKIVIGSIRDLKNCGYVDNHAADRIEELVSVINMQSEKIDYQKIEILELKRCVGLCMMQINDRELLRICDNALKHEMVRSEKLHG